MPIPAESLDQYIEAAVLLDKQVTDTIGPEPPDFGGAAPQETADPERQSWEPPMLQVPVFTTEAWAKYRPNKEYRELTSMQPELTALGEYAGQIVAVQRPVMIRDKLQWVINPGIIRGLSGDRGLTVTILSDPLDRKAPIIGRLQAVLLQTFAGLGRSDIGTMGAEEAAIRSGAALAAEKGHTFMGLRTLTDPYTREAVEAGQHVVHDWARNSRGGRGIAEELTGVSYSVGAYDITTKTGRRLPRRTRTLTIRPGGETSLIHHPAYQALTSRSEAAGIPLSVERIALAVGVEAAKALMSQEDAKLRDQLLRSLETINGSRND